jgi:hypothetical protein
MRLRAARGFSDRVPGREIVRTKSPIPVRKASEDSGPGWFEEFSNSEFTAEFLETCQLGKDQLVTLVRNVWELECLVRALDSMETLSSLAGLTREYDLSYPVVSVCFTVILANVRVPGKPAPHARCGSTQARRFAQLRRVCNPF